MRLFLLRLMFLLQYGNRIVACSRSRVKCFLQRRSIRFGRLRSGTRVFKVVVGTYLDFIRVRDSLSSSCFDKCAHHLKLFLS